MITSVAAVLVGQAMNVGMRPMAAEGEPALALDRLYWVEQNYLRAALIAANAALVDHHSGLGLAKAWGGGELASADGRFVVPVKTINAGINTKYFGKGREPRASLHLRSSRLGHGGLREQSDRLAVKW